MRLSKKILATLLPLTTAGTLAPALSSCNKGSNFNIAYGNSINCISNEYDKTVTGYRSIGDIQGGVKWHTSIETSPTLSETLLPQWNDEKTASVNQQKMYYDLIASHVFKMTIDSKDREPVPFTLIWKWWDSTQTDLTITFQWKDGETVKPAVTGKSLKYINKSGIAYIQIVNAAGTMLYEVKSYNFQNTTIGA